LDTPQEFKLIEDPKPTLSMHPHKFALWLFLSTIVMLFMAFTSAYIVRQAEGNWLEFELPRILWWNSLLLLSSSVSMHWAYISGKRDDLGGVKIGLLITLTLGVAFLVGQYLSWGQLVDQNVYFVGNPAGSFMYILTGMHGIHLISGVFFVATVLVYSLKYQVHSKKMVMMGMCTTYWHFLDGLWLYLFIFLLLNH